jgi:hypothetical protein
MRLEELRCGSYYQINRSKRTYIIKVDDLSNSQATASYITTDGEYSRVGKFTGWGYEFEDATPVQVTYLDECIDKGRWVSPNFVVSDFQVY